MEEAVQLLARGVQDVWLTGDPQVSFYRSTYRRHEQFAADTILHHVPLSGTVPIQRKGDLLGYMFLTAHDSNGSLVPGLDWSTLVDKVDLVIGRQTICSHDIPYINTIRGVLEASNWSQRFVRTEFQPLGFFTDTWPLPLSTLKYTDIDVVVSIKSQAYRYRLWTQQIFLSDSERKWFDTTTHRLLIPQVQRLPVTNEPSFRGPIKYIAWSSVNYSNVYSYRPFIPGSPLAFMTLNGNGADQGWGLSTDSRGNIYVSGSYTSSTVVPINNIGLPQSVSAYSLPITASNDAFLLKYASDGTISSFMTLQGTAGDQGTSIFVESSGNVYVTGYYTSSTLVPINNMGLPQSASIYTLPTTTGIDMFLLKYAPDGTISSFMTIKGTSGDRCVSVKVDLSGNIYVTGGYNSTTVVAINNMGLPQSASIYTLPITTLSDVFFLKYAPDGTISSFMTIKGNSTDVGNSTFIESTGNVYVTGFYSTSVLVPINNMGLPQSASGYSLPIASSNDVFLLKYAPDGTISSFMTCRGFSGDQATSVVVDLSGNIYVTGFYTSATSVGILNDMGLPQTTSTYTLPISSGNDVFILKYTPSGTIAAFTVLSGTGIDQGLSMVTDSTGNTYVTGFYTSTSELPINNITLSSTPVPSGYTLPATTGNDIFILKYRPDGTISSFTTFTGDSDDQSTNILVDSTGNLYITGYYNSSGSVRINTIGLNSTPVPSGYTLPVTSGNDMFLIKYGPS